MLAFNEKGQILAVDGKIDEDKIRWRYPNMGRAWNDFDEVYSVSDLHLGGASREGQIFNQGVLLAATIRQIHKRAGTERIALVLNGDIVDFLADENPMYLDPEGACRRLTNIMDNGSFKMIWDELSEFVKKSSCRLVLILGNHDVELALPGVRELIIKRLGGDENPEMRGRIEFAMDGTGYHCTVRGKKTVFFIHGNDEDDWNVVDQKNLRRIILAQNCGAKVPEWNPNPGTKLVIDAMNRIKRDYPFVDLLKPETRALPPILMAVNPLATGKFIDVSRGYVHARLTPLKRRMGLLTFEPRENQGRMTDEQARRFWLGDRPYTGGKALPSADDLLKEAEKRFQNNESILSEPDEDELLGVRDKAEEAGIKGLGKVLKILLKSDRSFDYQGHDVLVDALNSKAGEEVHYIVAGHTHLARSLARTNGAYFNSGTWARLIHLTRDILESREKFTRVYKALRKGTMSALDNLRLGDHSLIRLDPVVVRFREEKGRVEGCLCRAVKNQDGSVNLEQLDAPK